MAKKKKRPALTHCKVTATANPRAPWRVWFTTEQDGKPRRVFKSYADEETAWTEAAKKELEISNHGIRYGDIPPEVRRAFDFYRDEKGDLEVVGATVPRFEDLVSEALAGIRAAHNAREENALTVAEAVATFTDYKSGRVGIRQLDNLKNHLARFAGDFGKRAMRSITAVEIETWLASLRSRKNPAKLAVAPLLGPIARNAYRTSLNTFFKHGAHPSRGWCANNPVAAIESEKIATTEPHAYTPQAAAKIMQAALEIGSPLLPALALELFAGLRPSEAMALDLAAVDLASNDFRVPATHRNGEPTKTGARIAPLLPAAKAWIATQTRRAGFAYTGDRNGHSREMRRVLAAAKVTGIHDGARHSFISYRTADCRDVARVADECGNSVQIIKTSYRKIVTEAAAKVFFAIRPEKKTGRKSKITNIETGRKSA
jgi:integrase